MVTWRLCGFYFGLESRKGAWANELVRHTIDKFYHRVEPSLAVLMRF